MRRVETVLDRLTDMNRKPLRNGSSWMALCPAHDDRNPSLSISEGEAGKVLLHCFAGCPTEDVANALGLSMTGLFEERPEPHRTTKQPGPIDSPVEKDFASFCTRRGLERPWLEKYFGVKGNTLNGRPCLRYPTTTGIDRVKYLDGKKPKYGWAEKGGKSYAYGLDAALKCESDTLFLVNGEPSVWACVQEHVPAVCFLGENATPNDGTLNTLKESRFNRYAIVYDRDAAGKKGAQKVHDVMTKAGLDAVILELPSSVGPSGDVDNLHRLHDDKLGAMLSDLPEPFGAATRKLSDIEPEEVTWLWEPYIPNGKVTLLQGDPGSGKTFAALELCARLSRAGKTALFGTLEDGLGDTIRPRLERMDADLDKVISFEGSREDDGTASPVTLANGIEYLSGAIKKHRPALLVLDPLSAWLGGDVDINRSNQTRARLGPLVRLAEDSGTAVLLIQHLTKGKRDRALYRGLGSIDLVATARSVLMLGKTQEGQSAMVQAKNSLGKQGESLGFTIEDGAFRWTGSVDIQPGDILGGDTEGEDQSDAMAWLTDALQDGPQDAGELQRRFEKQTGESRRTLRRALKKLKGRTSKDGFRGGWKWELPEEDTPSPEGANKRVLVPLGENTTLKGLQGGQSAIGDTKSLFGPLDEESEALREEIDRLPELELIAQAKARRVELEGGTN